MEKLIAACGLDCATCGAYIAKKNNDNEKRKQVAAEWTTMFGFAFTPEMINCDGCLSTEGVHAGYCAECGIRKCALEKKVTNCGTCTEYPCKMVTDFHADCPEAAENLKAFR